MSDPFSRSATINCHRRLGRDSSEHHDDDGLGQKTLPMAGEIVEASEAVKTDSAKNAEDLLNNPLASDPLCCQANRQTEHCNSAVQLFRKDLCGIWGVGHEKGATPTNVKRCKEGLARHMLRVLLGVSGFRGTSGPQEML